MNKQAQKQRSDSLEKQIARAKADIKYVKSLGDVNFRDLEQGSPEDLAYRRVYPEQAEEILRWHSGPIATFGFTLCDTERRLLGSERLTLERENWFDWSTVGPQQLIPITTRLNYWNQSDISLVYMKGAPTELVHGWNRVLRNLNCNLRCKPTLLDKYGKPYND